MAPIIGQPELLKEINRSHAFETLKRTRETSRVELAQKTSLSRATIGLLVDELIQAQVAQEIGQRDSTGGRPARVLKFNPEAAYALGALMQDRRWVMVLTNLDAQVVERLEVNIADDEPATALGALKLGVTQLTTHSAYAGRVLPAIGVGTPGLVDMRTGIIQNAVDVGWSKVPFRAMAEDVLGLQTFVANRSKVGALAEVWHDADGKNQNLIYISIGTGVAAGIVEKGVLFTGSNSSAGELGHMTIIPDGPLCPCGNQGCLQQLVSGPAIANRARQRLRLVNHSLLMALAADRPERITAQMVMQAAEQGDDLALSIVNETATYLGIAIANVINLLNPDLVVIGGPIGQSAQVMLEPILNEVRRRAMIYPLSVARIVISTLGQDAGAIGAAGLVLQHTYELIFDKRKPVQVAVAEV